MKKIINLIVLISCLLCGLSSCKIDNYDGPNASFHGKIIDDATGELVGTDLLDGSTIQAFEHGYKTKNAQQWLIKETGEFRNNKVFAGTYNLELSGNFFPITVDDFKIGSGDNKHNFRVTPFIRIKNANISHENNQIVATFSLAAGKPDVEVRSVRLYAFTDKHVGHEITFVISGGNDRQTFNPSKGIDETEYTLKIDLTENRNNFQYSRNYYFRIGALAEVSDVGTVQPNYSDLQIIKIEM